jgi:hypothetical protein
MVALSAILVCPAMAGLINLGAPDDFILSGTAWDPGPNTARLGGNPAPGGATWSIMAAGLADGENGDDHAGMTTLLTDLSNSVDEITVIKDTLNAWAAVSGFSNLGQVTDGDGGFGTSLVGDIRIGAVKFDGAFNVLAHAFGPGTFPSNFATNYGGDTHFDNEESWTDGGDGIDFYTVALHEFGHALGLGHSAVTGAVMHPSYSGVNRTLHADDISGIQAIYGVGIPEPSAMGLFAVVLVGLMRVRRTSPNRPNL